MEKTQSLKNNTGESSERKEGGEDLDFQRCGKSIFIEFLTYTDGPSEKC